MAKKIAMTLKDIFNNPIAKTLMNRFQEVDWQELIDLWKPDMFSRKPAPAYRNNGDVQGTDLDLHTFLSALVDRGAVINIPEYHSMRGSVLKEGQMVVSKENRHGKCVGLSSNQDMFSFGVRIMDANVMMSDDVGDFRVFNLLDVEGNWHEGWRYLQFMPNKKENEFITQWQLDTDNKITFKHFISPWRRYSIYSAAYFLTKMAVVRIDDEAKYLSGLIDLMLKKGITYPVEEAPKEWPKSTPVGNEEKIKIKSVTFEIDIPPISGMYPEIPLTQESLIEITKRRKWLLYTVKPQLQYAIRGNEYANFKYITEGNEFPHWIQGVKWVPDYKQPPTFTVNADFIKKFSDSITTSILKLMKERSYKENELPQFFQEFSELKRLFFDDDTIPENIVTKASKGRVVYSRLVMFQEGVGKYGVSLLKKEFEKTEIVNKNYLKSDTNILNVKKI